MGENLIFDCIIWYFVFVMSTTLHEAAHAWASHRMGDDTAYEGGQVSLDPIPHIRREIWGMVIIPLLSFFLNNGRWMIGWASAPYDPFWALRFPRRAALMAMAGPLANLGLVVLAGILIHAGISAGIFIEPHAVGFTEVVLGAEEGFVTSLAFLVSIMFSLNVVLFVFNLLPVPPLDGSAIILFFLSEEKAQQYMNFIHQPFVGFVGFIIAWMIGSWFVIPVYWVMIALLY